MFENQFIHELFLTHSVHPTFLVPVAISLQNKIKNDTVSEGHMCRPSDKEFMHNYQLHFTIIGISIIFANIRVLIHNIHLIKVQCKYVMLYHTSGQK